MITVSREASLESAARAYQEGATILDIIALHPEVPQKKLRDHIKRMGLTRPCSKAAPDPSEEEIEREMAKFKSQWSEEESMRRWMGRSATPASELRGRYLSAILRD